MKVQISGLDFRRGKRQVLDIERQEFDDGAVTALVGRNGSGKTTLLRVIGGLERPVSGTVMLGDRMVRSAGDASAAVAIAFQRPVVLRGTVRANLELGLRLRRLDDATVAARIEEVAEALGIPHLLARSAQSLSGGESQRVNLARALSLHAPVTLLDEPLVGLDAETHSALLRTLPGLLRRFATTVIIVTHDHREATRLADQMVLLDGGRVSASGSVGNLLLSPPNVGAAAYFGFSIVPCPAGGAIALAPGSLRLEQGEIPFEVIVERVIDLGLSRELEATLRGVMVSIPIARDRQSPLPGQAITAFAPCSAVVRFP